MTLSDAAYVSAAVAIALLANTVAAIWASKDTLLNAWLPVVILISPIVFLTFGLVTARLGVVVSSATIDSLLTITTIIAGLFLFREVSSLGYAQYIGMALSLGGVFIMNFVR